MAGGGSPAAVECTVHLSDQELEAGYPRGRARSVGEDTRWVNLQWDFGTETTVFYDQDQAEALASALESAAADVRRLAFRERALA